MKAKFAVAVVTTALLVAACSTTPTHSVFKVKPAKPKAGDALVITFQPGQDSPIADEDSLLLQIWVFDTKPNVTVRADEVPLERSGSKWRAQYQMPEGAGCVVFQVSSAKIVGKVDANDEQAWHVLVCDDRGRPVVGAYRALASSYTYGGYLKRKRDPAKAAELLQKELALHPGDPAAKLALLSLQAREARGDSAKQVEILARADSLGRLLPDDPDLLSGLATVYRALGQQDRAAQVVDRIRNIAPNHRAVLLSEWSQIRSKPSAREQVTAGMELLPRVQNPDLRRNYIAWLANRMLGAGLAREAIAFLDTVKGADPSTLNSVAWTLIESDRQLIPATELAGVAVKRYEEEDPEKRRPSFMPQSIWRLSEKRSLGAVLDTYAFGLYKLGKLEEAERAYKRAVELSPSADIVERYAQCLQDLHKESEAFAVLKKTVEEGNTDPRLVEHLRDLAKKQMGDVGFVDSLVASVKRRAMASKRARVEKEIEEGVKGAYEAPPFKLATLSGDSVSLTDLRGKWVILDFWATWCGPCRQSFPYLQQFTKENNDGKVVVYTVNCWERAAGKERIDKVRKFVADNGYTFPVLLDMKDKVVRAYGVEGIPTKFFVGPDGKVYLKDVGFPGPTMLEDMKLKLQLLRKKTGL